MVPYGAIDLIYGFSTLESGHGFTNAQAALNIVEATLNSYFLFLRHTSVETAVGGKKAPYHAHAPIVGFAASLMTLSKTALYFLQGESSEADNAGWLLQRCSSNTVSLLMAEYYGGWPSVKHNSALDLVRYYFLPNVSLPRSGLAVLTSRGELVCDSPAGPN